MDKKIFQAKNLWVYIVWKENSESFTWYEYFIGQEPNLLQTETLNVKLAWSSEAWHHRMAYKVQIRTLVNFYNDWVLYSRGYQMVGIGLKWLSFIILGRWLKFCLWLPGTFTRNNLSYVLLTLMKWAILFCLHGLTGFLCLEHFQIWPPSFCYFILFSEVGLGKKLGEACL